MKRLQWFLVLFLLPMLAQAVEPLDANIIKELRKRVLSEEEVGGKRRLALYFALSNQMAQAGDKISSGYEKLVDKPSLQAWQQQVQTDFLNALGGFPERTDLKARVTGTMEMKDCRVEKILFESRPGFYVTALLYLPQVSRFKPPYPGVLIPCGHSQNGKAARAYQNGAVLAAANGIAAMIFDPIDQGERLQGSIGTATIGHSHVMVNAVLLGWNTATIMIWDGMRALDYLAGRPDVDATRLGCMGNSGGGTLTAFHSALDDRIVASSPSCYIASYQILCERRGPPEGPNIGFGPPEGEQSIYGQFAFGLEHSGLLMLRATKPTCVCAAQKDINPINITRQTVAEVAKVYARCNAAERILLAEYEGRHAWAAPLREAAVRWMVRWLRPGADFVMCPDDYLSDKDALVTPEGQVLKLPGARSAYDLMREEAARLAQARATGPKAGDLKEKVRRAANIRRLAEIPMNEAKEHSRQAYSQYEVRSVVLQIQDSTPLPATLFLPPQASGAPVLLVDGATRTNLWKQVKTLVASGRPVMAMDVSGTGETIGRGRGTWTSGVVWDEGPAVMAYVLGRSLVGIRAEDILAGARWLAGICGAERVDMEASSWAVTPALHAAASEPQLFRNLKILNAPEAWEDVIANGHRHLMSDVVHGALRLYSISDLKQRLDGVKISEDGF
ncbi:MAG: hypothetical protein WC340_16100 [Kiritimatiellia bacterium]